MRAKQGREGVGRLVAGAGGHNIVHRVVQFVRRALDALQIVPQGTRNSVFDGVGFLWHTDLTMVRPQSPVLKFWKLGAFESTGYPYRCA